MSTGFNLADGGAAMAALKVDGEGGNLSQQDAAYMDSLAESLLLVAEEYQNQTHWFSTETVVALVISYCLVISLGLVGNVLVVVVMLRRKELRTSRNIFILNLSFCDIVMCSVCMPFSLVKYIVKRWMLGAAMCRIVPALATIDVFVSTFTIIAIASDRYRSIVHASSSQRGNQRKRGPPYKIIWTLVICWVLSIGLAAPLFVFHELSTTYVVDKPVFHNCIEVWPHDRFREIYSTLVSVIQYLAPTIVISVFHARICAFLRRRIHHSPTSDSQIQRTQRQLKRHRKNLILLTAIAISFSVAWLPLTILNITADWTHDNTIFGMFGEEQFYVVHAICLLLAMTSSVINPLLYGWFNTNFRNAFLEILHLRRGSAEETSSLKDGRGSSGKDKRNYDSFVKSSSRSSTK